MESATSRGQGRGKNVHASKKKKTKAGKSPVDIAIPSSTERSPTSVVNILPRATKNLNLMTRNKEVWDDSTAETTNTAVTNSNNNVLGLIRIDNMASGDGGDSGEGMR